ncbi:MAG: GGDEF domain-containing protein [Lachnospiraceae bacterium]|nr:GGDEF domain-containing protein [Lachnospiraceae bacterium]
MSKLLKRYPQILQGALYVLSVALLTAAIFSGALLRRKEMHPVLELDAGWQVERNGSLLPEDTLTKIATGDVGKEESFTLTRVLTEENVWPSAALFFRNLHTAAVVSLDDEVIYTSGTDRYAQGKMVGRLLCYVEMPADWEGRTLTIRLTAAENNAFYGLGPFLFGTEQDLYVHFLMERIPAFYIAIFLLVFGVLQLFWMPLLLREGGGNRKLLFSALTTLVLGIYLLGYYNLFDLFTDTPGINTMLEYISLYALPLVMSGYLSAVMEGRLARLYRAFVIFDCMFLALILLSHALNIIHITSFLLAGYAVSFLEASPFLVHSVRARGSRGSGYFDRLEWFADLVLEIGFFLYVIGSFTDAAIFTFIRLNGGQEATVRVPFLTAGSLLFSVTVSAHYFLIGIVNLRTEATSQALQSKAYSDPLTGLSNRGECDLVLESLEKQYPRFLIASLDLDHLKEVNDTYGHAEGDRMLKGFAGALKECFPEAALTGRMGGDEFIVILQGNDCDRFDELLSAMWEKLSEMNRTEDHFQYNASVGQAQNGELKGLRSGHDVYLLADQRMYEAKRKRHEKLLFRKQPEAAV